MIGFTSSRRKSGTTDMDIRRMSHEEISAINERAKAARDRGYMHVAVPESEQEHGPVPNHVSEPVEPEQMELL